MLKKTILIGLLSFMSYSNASEGVNVLLSNVETHKIDEKKLQVPIPKKIKHSFDVFMPNQYNKVIRFLDMSIESGVDPKDIDIAIVIHGKEALKTIQKNNSDDKYDLLIKTGLVEVYACGQSLMNYGYGIEGLKSEVKLSLSAMTAHHYLQQNGYSINPF